MYEDMGGGWSSSEDEEANPLVIGCGGALKGFAFGGVGALGEGWPNGFCAGGGFGCGLLKGFEAAGPAAGVPPNGLGFVG